MSFREMVKQGDIEGVRASIGKVKNINARNRHRETYLHEAVRLHANEAQSDIVRQLVDAGASIDAKDVWNRSALWLTYDVDTVNLLIDCGADVNAKCWQGKATLHSVCQVEKTRALIRGGADVNARDDGGNTPLHCAHNLWHARVLINAGAEIFVLNHENLLPHQTSCLAEFDREKVSAFFSDAIRKNLQASLEMPRQPMQVKKQRRI